jgi:acyl carrier protein
MSPQHEETVAEIFRVVFNLGPQNDVTRVRQLSTPAWDSLAHVTMVAALESEFGLEVALADSLELTSYEAVLAYLEERFP